jgi:DNA-binding response OmpR family regulator
VFEATGAASSPATVPEQNHRIRGTPMRILIAEDEAHIASDIAGALSAAGYVTEIVSDGEEAWLRGETDDLDGIVMDLGLPRLDGLTVVRRLRSAGVMTPILILTARTAWTERVEGIDAGADDYLTKPFHTEELLARLSALLRRAGGHVTPVLESGPLRIDTRRMSITRDGRSLTLSPLEYRLVRYLVHHRGRVLSQGELAEHVYASQEPDSNALEVLIARARRKIGGDVIVTRRGYGYLVEA